MVKLEDKHIIPSTPVALIATSMGRWDLLLNRSLPSALRQEVIPRAIVIVDDNDSPAPRCVTVKIDSTCRRYGVRCHLLRNVRTCHMSGTGAWNTGIRFIADSYGANTFVAILDDDDEWLPAHIKVCRHTIQSCRNVITAVLPMLRRTDCHTANCFRKRDLTIDVFLEGNPGIQGSNMVFRVSDLLAIDGFDENLPSCTDRDLMIRYLAVFGTSGIRVVNRVTVKHHADANTVTACASAKTTGLDRFYEKHIQKFSQSTLDASLERAGKLFHYSNWEKVRRNFGAAMRKIADERIVIGVAMHNNADSIRACLSSIFAQRGLRRRLCVVLYDDASTDKWREAAADFLGKPNLEILHGCNRMAAKTRNAINRHIIDKYHSVALIGRLDADDVFADETVLSRLEKFYDQSDGANCILAGNYQRTREGRILRHINRATVRLLETSYLIGRLKRMANGDAFAELPSCNLFFTPDAWRDYPEINSAEDHALLVDCLCDRKRCRFRMAKDLLLTIYTLGGKSTMGNKAADNYLDARRQLVE